MASCYRSASRSPNLPCHAICEPEAQPGRKQGQPAARLAKQPSRGDCRLRFFTVPTLCFRTLHCFFAIEHGRRRILHFNVTFHPTGDWIVQQLREAFPLPCPYRYVLFEHDAKFGNDLLRLLKSSDPISLRTSVRSPSKTEWRNVVGECTRELLNQVSSLNEFHLRRVGRGYHAYTTEAALLLASRRTLRTNKWSKAFSPQSRVVSKSRLAGV